MVNRLLLLAVILIMVLGCGMADRVRRAATEGDSNPATANSNKTLTDKAVDTAVGNSKIGIPECDEVMDLIQAELDNADDNFVTKAIKATVLNRIKDGIRESVDKNRNSNGRIAKDDEEMAKTCREFRTQFDKYKAEEQRKASQK
jgi:hypothetical protein